MSIINFSMKKALFISLVYSLLYPSIMQGMFLQGKAKERQAAMIKRMEQRKTEKHNLRLLPLKFGELEKHQTREQARLLFHKNFGKYKDVEHERTISSQLKLGSFRPEEQQKLPVVWINTNNGTRSIEQWKIEQTDLKALLVEQKGTNSKNNPLQVRTISDKQLLLLSHAFDALINGTFTTYLKDLQNESQAETGSRLLDLGLVVERVGANKINRLLGLEIASMLPSEGPVKQIHNQISSLSSDKHLVVPKDIYSAGINKYDSTCVISDRSEGKWNISVVDMNTLQINNLFTTRSRPEDCLINKTNSSICYWKPGLCKLWNIDQQSEIRLHNFTFPQFSPDGNHIIGFSISNTGISIRDFDIKAATEKLIIYPTGQSRGNTLYSSSLSWSFEEVFFVFAFETSRGSSGDPEGSSLEFYLCNIENGTCKQLFYDKNINHASCCSTAISPDNNKCAYLSDNHIIVYDIPKEAIISQIDRKNYFKEENKFEAGAIAFNQNGTQCFVDQARYNCIINIDTASGKHSKIILKERKQNESNDAISHTLFSPDGSTLAVVKEPLLLLYDSQTGVLLNSINIGANVEAIAFTNDGKKLTVIRKNSIDTYNCHYSAEKIDINKEVNQYSSYLQNKVNTSIQWQPSLRSRLGSYLKSWWS